MQSSPTLDPETLLDWARAVLHGGVAAAGPGPAALAEELERSGRPLGPSARRLLARLAELGLDPPAVQEWLVQLLATAPELQHRWQDWPAVTDRQELGLRLELLARSPVLAPESVPFVIFCFRASVADLYQPAAVALGRHRRHHPELAAYLEGYARDRGIDLDQPLILDGRRTARRLFLVLAAEPGPGSPLPQRLSIDPQTLPSAAADLATLLLGLALMRRFRPEEEDSQRLLAAVIAAVPKLADAAFSRSVVQRYGELLLLAPGEPAAAGWRSLYTRLAALALGRDPLPVGRRTAALLQLDELLHTLALSPDPRLLVEELGRQAQPFSRVWTLARSLSWIRREGGLPPWAVALLQTLPPGRRHTGRRDLLDRRGLMDWLLHDVLDPADAGDDPGNRRDAPRLAALLEEIRDRPRWRSHDAFTRSALALLLLDQAGWASLPGDQMAAMLERFGLAASDPRPGARRGETRPEWSPQAAVSAVLLRLLTWEDAGAEVLVDVRMLHRIDDLRVLLALVAPGRPSPLNTALADALEHQLRWRLRTDPQFEPVWLLQTLAVRRPDGGLYRALREVCRDRTYRRVDGSELAVMQFLEAAAPDASGEAEAPLPEAAPRLLHHLRQAMAEPLDPLDLPAALNRWLRLIGVHGEAGGASLLSLLESLHGPRGPLLGDGYPAWQDATVGDLAPEVQACGDRIQHALPSLLPQTWESLDPLLDAALLVERELAQLRRLLAPVLPPPQRQWLERTAVELQVRLGLRRRNAEEILGGHARSALWSGSPSASALDAAMEAINALEDTALQAHLLTLLPESLCQWVREAHPQAPEQAWSGERAVLDWTLAAPVRGTLVETWRAQVSSLWARLTEQAMDRHETRRALDLLRHAAYREPRASGAGRELMHKARPWCYERLRLGEAVAIARERRAAAGRRTGPAVLVRELGGFAVHYSAVWLALLIGCIFMLDFGDPWKAMAEIGDVPGIAVTFILGVAGTYAYLLKNLSDKGRILPGESVARAWRSRCLRAGVFLLACLAYTLALTGLMWLLLSGTGEVVEGPGALGHIVVWSGFALFMGVFFGLIAESKG